MVGGGWAGDWGGGGGGRGQGSGVRGRRVYSCNVTIHTTTAPIRHPGIPSCINYEHSNETVIEYLPADVGFLL